MILKKMQQTPHFTTKIINLLILPFTVYKYMVYMVKYKTYAGVLHK